MHEIVTLPQNAYTEKPCICMQGSSSRLPPRDLGNRQSSQQQRQQHQLNASGWAARADQHRQCKQQGPVVWVKQWLVSFVQIRLHDLQDLAHFAPLFCRHGATGSIWLHQLEQNGGDFLEPRRCLLRKHRVFAVWLPSHQYSIKR